MRIGRHAKRKGVSPVPAELMLIALVVAGGVIVYIFVSGLGGRLTKAGSSGVTEQLSLDAYNFPKSGPLTFTLRDVGTTTLTIQLIYFNGAPVSSPGCAGVTVSPTETVQCSFQPSPIPSYGSSVLVKAVTTNGGYYQFTVVVGGT